MSQESILDVTTVSRKTPRDGKLEVTQAVSERLTSVGPSLEVVVDDSRATGAIEAMACTCARADGAGHVHYFLVSEVLRTLEPEARVSLGLDVEQRVVRARTLR